MIRVAINGFGRIGRNLLRILLQEEQIEVVAVNDLADKEALLHLFKYDSVHGRFKGEVCLTEDGVLIEGKHEIRFLSEKDVKQLPWKALDVDYVVESTGKYKTKELASLHLKSGAKCVLISAPPEDANIKTICIGINDNLLDGTEQVISNASCTTNSAAPLVSVMKDLTEIETAYITTVHSYTTDQKLHDVPHKDLRRARAAAMSIVPTTTGAAKAITRIFPDLAGKMGGCGIRVPVPDGSLTDITFIVKKELSIEEVNTAFKTASIGSLKGILEYTNDPIVSIDIIDNEHSCIFDAQLTSVIGKMVKVVGWYDNEIGYSNRLKDLLLLHASKNKA